MKIVRFYKHGGPSVLQIDETEIPKPRRGEVVLRVEAAGVNFTDISHRRGSNLREPLTLPYTPGVEAAGTVTEIGDGVTNISVGERIIAVVPFGGGYAEYIATTAAGAIPIPPGLTSIQAAALPVQGLTAYHITSTFGHLQPGERILVQAAAGGVGTLAVQLARIFGAAQIIAAASSPSKLALAKSLGADATVDYTRSDWETQVLKATDGRGVDLILDMIGGPQFSRNFSCLAPLGRIVMFGAASGQRGIIDAERLTSRCYTVTGYYTGFVATLPEAIGPALQNLFQFVLSGQLKLHIRHDFSLADAAEVHRQMEERLTTGKIVLVPSLTRESGT